MRIALFREDRLRGVVEGDPTSLAATVADWDRAPVLRALDASPFEATPFAALIGVSLRDFDAAVRAAGAEPRAPDLTDAFIDLALRHAGI